jgi:hypothetical protein
MPLVEAFERIMKARRSRDLTERDLLHHLRAGRLIAAARSVGRDGTETCQQLKPDYWNGLRLTHVSATGQVRVDGRRTFAGSSWFFVRRRDLDKLYPAAAAVAGSPDGRASARKLRLRSTTHDWFTICGEIARRCHDRSGRIAVPKNESKLAREVAAWLVERGKEEPADSELREAVRHICAALREAKI